MLQIKSVDSGIRITKIRSEQIHVKFSQLIVRKFIRMKYNTVLSIK